MRVVVGCFDPVPAPPSGLVKWLDADIRGPWKIPLSDDWAMNLGVQGEGEGEGWGLDKWRVGASPGLAFEISIGLESK